MSNINAFFPKIKDAVCPRCKGELIKTAESITCQECGDNYDIIDGIPLLLRRDLKILFEDSPVGLELPLKLKLNFLKPVFSLKLPIATRRNLEYFSAELKVTDRLLIIGGGMEHYGVYIRKIGAEKLKNSINLEVAPGPFVDLVADAHDIPFPDNYFDGIICQSVLEHTRDSGQVVAEAYRVLKPGGIIFVEVPFLQPVHMISDFRRYSLLGLDNLFSAFEKVGSGVNAGISSAFCMVSVNFFSALFSFNSMALYRAWRLIFRLLFAPIKFLDYFLSKYSMAPVTSSENYFIGRKRLQGETT